MINKILIELNDSIQTVEYSMGENSYDSGYYDALVMVRDQIIKPLQEA